MTLLSRLHDADTPIHICRKAIVKIIMDLAGDIRAGIKRLMTDEHSPLERAPVQLLGRRKTAMAQEPSLVVHDIGISIKHARQVLALAYASLHILQGIVRRKHVSRIQKHEIVARGTVDALVHGVIESLVGFRIHHDFVGILSSLCPVLVCPNHCQGLVLRNTIYDQVLDVAVSLLIDTIQRTLQHTLSIVGTSYDGKLNHIR